jgi:hypothetical protein
MRGTHADHSAGSSASMSRSAISIELPDGAPLQRAVHQIREPDSDGMPFGAGPGRECGDVPMPLVRHPECRSVHLRREGASARCTALEGRPYSASAMARADRSRRG